MKRSAGPQKDNQNLIEIIITSLRVLSRDLVRDGKKVRDREMLLL